MNDTYDDHTSRDTLSIGLSPGDLLQVGPGGLLRVGTDNGVLALRAALRGLSDAELRERADRLEVAETQAHDASEAAVRATHEAELRATATELAEDAAAARAARVEDDRVYAAHVALTAEEEAVWREQSRRAHVLQGGTVVAPTWVCRLVFALTRGVDTGLELVRLCWAALVLGLIGAWLAPHLLPTLTAAERAQTVGVVFNLILIAAVVWWAVPDWWFARTKGHGRAGR